MPTLKDIAKAITSIKPNHSILLYGPPKTGKTKLAGTAAKIPEVERIFWFDLENGIETLLHSGLTDEELEKIHVIKVPNTRDNPVGIETLLKAFSAKAPIKICDEHGKVGCVPCKDKEGTMFSLGTCTHNDLVIIDSGSELGDSALAAACLGKGEMFKPGWDEYGIAGKWLGDIMSVIQQARSTNFIVLTHEIALEDESGKDRIFPLVGSKSFSMKVAKYFGSVVYVHKKMNKHVAGSSSTYRGDLVTGSRVDARIEDAKEANMHQILIEGGILKPSGEQEKPSVETPPEASGKSTGLASILKARTQSA